MKKTPFNRQKFTFFYIFMKMRKQRLLFIISWFIFTKAFHCRPWFSKGNGWLKILLLIYLSCVIIHFKYPFTLKSAFQNLNCQNRNHSDKVYQEMLQRENSRSFMHEIDFQMYLIYKFTFYVIRIRYIWLFISLDILIISVWKGLDTWNLVFLKLT